MKFKALEWSESLLELSDCGTIMRSFVLSVSLTLPFYLLVFEFIKDAWNVFACNSWKNNRKQMNLVSEALPVHANTVREYFAVFSTDGSKWHSFSTCESLLHCKTESFQRTCGPFDRKDWHPQFFFLCGYMKQRVYRKKASHHTRLERQHPTGDGQHLKGRTTCNIVFRCV
jgi:hypothetical protein